MATAKIAITMDADTIKKLDRMVGKRIFPNRSRAIQEAVEEKLSRMDKNRLARECEKLNPKFEQILAEEDIHMESSEWPEY
jgi:metal-responsive CopG/Arc/MetJ family transcriptional regulator